MVPDKGKFVPLETVKEFTESEIVPFKVASTP